MRTQSVIHLLLVKKCVVLRASGSEPARLGWTLAGSRSGEFERSGWAELFRVTLGFFCSQRSREIWLLFPGICLFLWSLDELSGRTASFLRFSASSGLFKRNHIINDNFEKVQLLKCVSSLAVLVFRLQRPLALLQRLAVWHLRRKRKKPLI